MISFVGCGKYLYGTKLNINIVQMMKPTAKGLLLKIKSFKSYAYGVERLFVETVCYYQTTTGHSAHIVVPRCATRHHKTGIHTARHRHWRITARHAHRGL